MLSHGVGGVHENLWHGGEVLDSLQPQPQEVAVYGLPVDCLIKNTKNNRNTCDVDSVNRNVDIGVRPRPYFFGRLPVGLDCLAHQGDLLCVLLRGRRKGVKERDWTWSAHPGTQSDCVAPPYPFVRIIHGQHKLGQIHRRRPDGIRPPVFKHSQGSALIGGAAHVIHSANQTSGAGH